MTPGNLRDWSRFVETILKFFLFATLSFVAATVARSAHAEGNTAKLNVVARVATFFRMQVEHQAVTITVTPRDIQRGYVEVDAASRFSVVTNAQGGFIVDCRPRSDVFLAVQVTGLQSPIEFGAHGGMALHNVPHGQTAIHELGYRFMLRADIKPGNYPWPLEISVRPA